MLTHPFTKQTVWPRSHLLWVRVEWWSCTDWCPLVMAAHSCWWMLSWKAKPSTSAVQVCRSSQLLSREEITEIMLPGDNLSCWDDDAGAEPGPCCPWSLDTGQLPKRAPQIPPPYMGTGLCARDGMRCWKITCFYGKEHVVALVFILSKRNVPVLLQCWQLNVSNCDLSQELSWKNIKRL